MQWRTCGKYPEAFCVFKSCTCQPFFASIGCFGVKVCFKTSGPPQWSSFWLLPWPYSKIHASLAPNGLHQFRARLFFFWQPQAKFTKRWQSVRRVDFYNSQIQLSTMGKYLEVILLGKVSSFCVRRSFLASCSTWRVCTQEKWKVRKPVFFLICRLWHKEGNIFFWRHRPIEINIHFLWRMKESFLNWVCVNLFWLFASILDS